MKNKLFIFAFAFMAARFAFADTGFNQTTKVIQVNPFTVTPGTGAFSVNGSTLGVVQTGSPWGTTQTPGASGGLVIYSTNSVINSTQTVKGAAGQVYGWNIYNGTAAIRWVHFYDSSSVSMGTTADVFAIAIPPTSLVQGGSESGIAFTNSITISATTASSPKDNGAPSTNDVQAVIFYK